MKLFNVLTALAIAAALAACATQPPPPVVHHIPGNADTAADPGAMQPAVPAPAPMVTPEEAKVKLLQQKREAQQLKQEMDDESRRLASYQKNLFQVFRLSESAAGLQAKPNALGVFESKAAKSGKLRVSLAQLPDSPARLNVGSYTINLDVLVEYVETRECIAGGCVGKTQNMVRSVPKTVQISISPKSGFCRYARIVLPRYKACRAECEELPHQLFEPGDDGEAHDRRGARRTQRLNSARGDTAAKKSTLVVVCLSAGR